MWNSKFGYIYLTKNGNTQSKSPERIDNIDVQYVVQQADEWDNWGVVVAISEQIMDFVNLLSLLKSRHKKS